MTHTQPPESPAPPGPVLRPYQWRTVDRTREAFSQGYRRPLVVAPTGSGKTTLFTHMAGEFQKRGRRCLVLVPRVEILSQASATFTRSGVEHGIIAAGTKPSPGEPIQIGMVQTVARRLDVITPPEWIVLDEAHHACAKTYGAVLDAFPGARVVGFSATPCRADGRGLDDIFDCIVPGPSVAELQDHGFLSLLKCYCPPVVADLDGVSTVAGDFHAGEMAEAMSKADVLGDAVEHYKRLGNGQPGVAFCCSVKHAEAVRDRFNEAGIPAAVIHGGLPADERKSVVAALESGAIKIMTSVDVVSEGFDCPNIAVGIMLRRTKSLALYLQQAGRILRPSPGKEFSILLDHCGNVLEHGLPQDERGWSLQGTASRKPKTAAEARWNQCGQCYAMFKASPKNPGCPECGAVRTPAVAKERVEVLDAELVEFTPPPKLPWHEVRERILRARRPKDLLPLARRQGYKPGWAYKIFDEIHGRRAA